LLSAVLLVARFTLVSTSFLGRLGIRRKLQLEEEIERKDLTFDTPGYDSKVLKKVEARTRWIQALRVVVCFSLLALAGYLLFQRRQVEGIVLIVCYVSDR
jgi:hypothetical protein